MTAGTQFPGSGGGLAQSAAKHFGHMILRGDLLPGAPLPPENEILAKIGIGRSTLREPFRILSSKGFMSSRQRSGTRVRPREEWNDLDLMVIAWTAAIFAVDRSCPDFTNTASVFGARGRPACGRAREWIGSNVARDGNGAHFAMRCLVEDAILTFRRSRRSGEAESGQ